jgi:hypothetical protein
VFELHDGVARAAPAKVEALVRLAREGVRVPHGVVLEPGELGLADDVRCSIDALLADGPVIVRSALAVEDQAEATGAGLGMSVPGCRTIAEIRAALARIQAHGRDPWLAHYRNELPHGQVRDLVLVQHEVAIEHLVVAALEDGDPYVEIHGDTDGPLAAGTTPVFAGPLADWCADARADVARLCEEVAAVLRPRPPGLDLELAVDARNIAWLVQARPLTRPLCPGWDEFRAEVERSGAAAELERSLVLDAEHNPAPLSPAHAGLMRRLARARDDVGGPTVLAGWLYVDNPTSAPTPLVASADPRAVLRRLRDELLPAARADLRALERTLEGADAVATNAALARALGLFFAMLDTYMAVIVPARAAASHRVVQVGHTPFSLRDRDRHLDVLPASWDIASPPLGKLGGLAGRAVEHLGDSSPLPSDHEGAATLLAQWDDHLFALGLMPLRRVYLHAARVLGLDQDGVFMLDPDELALALQGRLGEPDTLVCERSALHERFAGLRPPARIEAGRPLPAPGGHLRGIPVGPPFEGTVAPRTSLADVLENPPIAGQVLTIPALTAQAAVALHHLGVRAVCCEFGGALSHATLMARELGLSALVGCRGCSELGAGRRVRLDTRLGRLVVAPASRTASDDTGERA